MLGFRIEEGRPEVWIYVHETYGVLLAYPVLPLDDEVRDYHMIGMLGMLDGFGIASRQEFKAMLMLPPNPNDLAD